MRLVVLDTETTGTDPDRGDRIVEIGAILIEKRKIRRDVIWHRYLNPERPIPEETTRIHGITDEMVKDAPRFFEIADELLAFLRGATLVIHNASFDLKFLASELERAGKPFFADAPVIDTLAYARRRHPGERCSLDALCDRYGVDRSRRTKHGALLDAELLAEVYLAMTGGAQFSLTAEVEPQPARAFLGLPKTTAVRNEKSETANIVRPSPIPVSEEDKKRHQAFLDRMRKLGAEPLWLAMAGS